MNCPRCQQNNNQVVNSRKTKNGNQIWRRRRCKHCESVFTTYEQRDLGYMKILKQSGSDEPFQRHKLFSSLYKTFDQLPGQTEKVYFLTETIEDKIVELEKTEVSSEDIAKITLETLSNYHKPAKLRYGSFRSHLL